MFFSIIRFLFCVVLYAVAMEGVNFATHQIVGSFAAPYIAAIVARPPTTPTRYFERRR
jgi:hypothetical protein